MIRSYYYNSVLTVVRNTASVQNASLVNYSEDNTVDFSASVRTLVENFADKDRMELMAIDKNGTVIITSSGFSPSGDLEMPDYEAALSSSTRDGLLLRHPQRRERAGLHLACAQRGRLQRLRAAVCRPR